MDGVKGTDWDKVQTSKDIVVESPEECPFNTSCQCSLYGMFEGEQARECPLGSYGHYEFPLLCPLKENNHVVKLGSL